MDENAVDLVSGSLLTGATDVSIGPNNHHGLRHTRQWGGMTWRITSIPLISGSSLNPVVSYEGKTIKFNWVGSA